MAIKSTIIGKINVLGELNVNQQSLSKKDLRFEKLFII